MKIEKKKTKSILSKQIKNGLSNIKNKSNIFIAYEPVWAIGSGVIPQSEDLFKTIEFIKSKFKGKLPKILYGGSVNDNNASSILEIDEVGGVLVGGASLIAEKFWSICTSANHYSNR